MSRFKIVKLSDVWAMLNHCLPQHTRRKTDHYYRIIVGSKTYPSFPTGEHGRSDPEIEFGHVMKLARFFEIIPCVELYWGIKKKTENPTASGDNKD